MKLSETTFNEFINYCEEEKKHWHTERQYVTVPKLKMIYDYYVKHDMECKGNRLTITIDGKWNSSFSSPLEYKPTREDYASNLFHEVWCKAEWACRCSRSETELGYDAVKGEFGLKMIKALKEA